VLEHISVIAQKAKRPENEIFMVLESILERFHKVESRNLLRFIEESVKHVKDEEDSLYVATALHLKRSFKQIIIITWNKRDFKFWQLMRQWIRVLTPREFYVNYLRFVLRPQLAPPCLACVVDRQDMVIKATLLYLNEPDYVIRNIYLMEA